MFVKYECDCVGLVLDQRSGGNILHALVKVDVRCHCEGELSLKLLAPDNLHLSKTYSPLTEDEMVPLVGRLDKLVNDGYRFRTILHALG